MSNGEVCCILGVCCPPAERKGRLVAAIARDNGWSLEESAKAFDWFDSRVDFAPKGTMGPLFDAIVAHAKYGTQP